MITNFRVSLGNKMSLFGFYSLNFANSDLGSGGPISISLGAVAAVALAGLSAEAAEALRSS